jgi:hypothetical protein
VRGRQGPRSRGGATPICSEVGPPLLPDAGEELEDAVKLP